MNVRATIIELWSRVTKYDKHDDIYHNGENNLYPNEIEKVVMNSPTASRSAQMMSKFIAGQGVKGENPVVNKKKGYHLSDIVKAIADDISIQNGSFIHVGYGFNDQGKLIRNKLTVLDYTQCRIGKEDDNDMFGKIWLKDYETSTDRFARKDKKKAKWFYPYNPDPEVVIRQINADAKTSGAESVEDKIRHYKGQVFYLNLTPRFKYALSKFNAVYNDCDTEYRMSLYSNTVTRGGFMGKTAILTQGLDVEQADKIKDDVRKWLGAEGSGDVYHLDVEQADDLDKIFKVVQIESQYEDDMYTNLDKRIIRNISGAANNIPEALIYVSQGAMFGSSGEAYNEMKEFYNEQTQSERQIIEQTLTTLGFPVEIEPFYYNEPEPEPEQEEEEEEIEETAEEGVTETNTEDGDSTVTK